MPIEPWWETNPATTPRQELGMVSPELRKQIDAQLGKPTGAELSAIFVRCCLVPLSGLCRPVWISRMTKPAEDRVAGEFNPAGRLTGPCDNFFN